MSLYTIPPVISCFFGAGKKRQLMAGSDNLWPATYGRTYCNLNVSYKNFSVNKVTSVSVSPRRLVVANQKGVFYDFNWLIRCGRALPRTGQAGKVAGTFINKDLIVMRYF